MVLANGSSIGISTTSSDAGRGDSCNVLILDELAFIDDHLVNDFWKSVFPIISSSKKSKILKKNTFPIINLSLPVFQYDFQFTVGAKKSNILRVN